MANVNLKRADRMSTMQLHELACSIHQGVYVQNLYGFRQTHAVYGFNCGEALDAVKEGLKKHGAYKFRTVKNAYGLYILYFSNVKMAAK